MRAAEIPATPSAGFVGSAPRLNKNSASSQARKCWHPSVSSTHLATYPVTKALQTAGGCTAKPATLHRDTGATDLRPTQRSHDLLLAMMHGIAGDRAQPV